MDRPASRRQFLAARRPFLLISIQAIVSSTAIVPKCSSPSVVDDTTWLMQTRAEPVSSRRRPQQAAEEPASTMSDPPPLDAGSSARRSATSADAAARASAGASGGLTFIVPLFILIAIFAIVLAAAMLIMGGPDAARGRLAYSSMNEKEEARRRGARSVAKAVPSGQDQMVPPMTPPLPQQKPSQHPQEARPSATRWQQLSSRTPANAVQQQLSTRHQETRPPLANTHHQHGGPQPHPHCEDCFTIGLSSLAELSDEAGGCIEIAGRMQRCKAEVRQCFGGKMLQVAVANNGAGPRVTIKPPDFAGSAEAMVNSFEIRTGGPGGNLYGLLQPWNSSSVWAVTQNGSPMLFITADVENLEIQLETPEKQIVASVTCTTCTGHDEQLECRVQQGTDGALMLAFILAVVIMVPVV